MTPRDIDVGHMSVCVVYGPNKVDTMFVHLSPLREADSHLWYQVQKWGLITYYTDPHPLVTLQRIYGN